MCFEILEIVKIIIIVETVPHIKDRALAFGITTIMFALLFLFLFLYVIITPLPIYPTEPEITVIVEGGGGADGAEGLGDPQLTGSANPNINTSTDGGSDNVLTSSVADPDVVIKENKKKNKKDKVSEQKTTDPQPSKELTEFTNLMKDKLKHGSGNNADNPDGNGKTDNGMGPGKGDSDGPGSGNGVGPGSGPGFLLKGRKLLKRPELLDDSQEEGIVVVEIVVDQTGKVIDAIPGQRGSTTTSAYLYTLARQAAKTAKFNESPDGATEQHGTITIVFKLQ